MGIARTAGRQRLDAEIVARGLASTHTLARALILAGDVLVNGRTEPHAGTPVAIADRIELTVKPRFASRGGEKLDFALEHFGLDIVGRVAVDLGASTGGFTDCLLQRGAAKVYAVDVGYGQLDRRLRLDERVVVCDRTNARYLESLAEPVTLATIDVSFISLRTILPTVRRLLMAEGDCVPLIKPQFEAGRHEVGKGGVVRQPAVHRRVLEDVLGAAEHEGFTVRNLIRSPLKGPAGNVEFLAHLGADKDGARSSSPAIELMIDRALGEWARSG